jgi:hypothetical protein
VLAYNSGGQTGLRVTVANDDRVTSLRCGRSMAFSITGEHFVIECYGLTLRSYEMVLDVQWLEALGPILWDFAHRWIQFMRGSRTDCWTATDHALTAVTYAVSTDDVLDDLLLRFEGLFTEPTGLPPVHPRSHRIRLLPGTTPVAVRPYRYAYMQKEELERQCQEMLRQGVIWPRSLAFSAPVLQVKKADDAWRFCVDYRALNAKTVKDKYPIPVVEELLDELQGAALFTKLDLQSGYQQVCMHDDMEKTAFRTHEGLFEFLVMPFGLTNAPATFQALMNDVLQPFLCRFILFFFDDNLIYSSSWLEHLRHVHLVLAKL